MRAHVEVDGGDVRVLIDIRGRTETARITVPDGFGPDRPGDVALAVALQAAMRWGEDLVLDQPVSARLLAASEVTQDVWTTWDRAIHPTERFYSRVRVDAPVAGDAATAGGSGPTAPAGGPTLACFTAGVDSCHTALARGDLDGLVFVHGFDVALAEASLRRVVGAGVRAAAAGVGLGLIEVESDLHEVGERLGVAWLDYHGAALAAVGHALGAQCRTLVVPATHTYAHLEGLGSHPILDPLWSGEGLEVVHHGASATRVDKILTIDGAPAVREHLRVCWENRDGAYNCGRCEKCVRTGVAVRIAGCEGRFPTIPTPSLADVARARVTSAGSPWQELRSELAARDTNPRLGRAIDVALARHQLRRWRLTRWMP